VSIPDPSETPSGWPGIYTAEEAAIILKVSADWLRRRAAARKIPFTMPGGSYHFTDAHLAEIIRLYEHVPADRTDKSAQSTGGKQRRAAPRTRRQQDGAAEVTQLRPRPEGARRKNQSAA
jgi:excisionase family DNA binding protein